MSTAGTRYFSLAPQETADWLFDGLSSRDPRGPQLTGHVFRSGDGERGSWDRGKVRCRRILPVRGRPGEGHLAEPIAEVQPARRKLVFMPHSRPSRRPEGLF